MDLVRKLDESGELPAERTPGGHRRWRRSVVDEFMHERASAHARRRAPAAARARTPGKLSKQVLPQRPALVANEEWPERPWLDDLEELELPPTVTSTKVIPAPKPTEDDWVKRLTEENLRAAEERRLRSLKTHGENRIPLLASAGARSAVIEMLASYVTSDRFSSSMPSWEAYRAIDARVAATLEPFEKAERQESCRNALIQHGLTYADRETADWEWALRDQARARVAAVLNDEVEADTRNREVEDLVEEILDEWCEDEAEDEDD